MCHNKDGVYEKKNNSESTIQTSCNKKYVNDLNTNRYKDSNLYYATVDTNRKLVIVYNKQTGEVEEEIRLKTTPIDIEYSSFRRATSEDIENGEPLYVRDKRTSTTGKYIPEPDEVSSIATKYKL